MLVRAATAGAAVALGLSALTVAPAPAAAAPAQPRIAGADRWQTAVEVARAEVGDRAGRVQHVVLANGDSDKGAVDALSASALAGALHAPVLLTSSAGVPGATAQALRDLFGATPVGGATLHVIGGDAVVPPAQVDALRAALPGVDVVRLQGPDRFATARAVALEAATSGAVGTYSPDSAGPAERTVILANGITPADALIAGQVAVAGGYPLLLTRPGDLPEATADGLRRLGAQRVVVLGGPVVVGDGVVTALTSSGYRLTRVYGQDRYETAAALLTLASGAPGGSAQQPGGMGLPFAAAASGYLISDLGTIDAIAAGPLAGAQLRPLLPTPPTELAPATGQWFGASSVTSVTGVGGEAVLPEDLLTATNAVLGAPVEPAARPVR